MGRKLKQLPADNDDFIRKIIADPNYRVTERGTLETRNSVNGQGLMPKDRWREVGGFNSYGYRVYKPKIDGAQRNILIHRVVYAALIGTLDRRKVVNHKDGNRANNHPDNLELVSWEYNGTYRAD